MKMGPGLVQPDVSCTIFVTVLFEIRNSAPKSAQRLAPFAHHCEATRTEDLVYPVEQKEIHVIRFAAPHEVRGRSRQDPVSLAIFGGDPSKQGILRLKVGTRDQITRVPDLL